MKVTQVRPKRLPYSSRPYLTVHAETISLKSAPPFTQLYTYPIKSLRSVPLTHTFLTLSGLPYDRRFLLVRLHPHHHDSHPTTTTTARTAAAAARNSTPPLQQQQPNPRSKSHYNPTTGLENMTITYYPELALFLQEIDEERGVLTVKYDSPLRPSGSQENHDEEQSKEEEDEMANYGERKTRPSLKIPLEPDIDGLETLDVDLHGSLTRAYRMGEEYSGFFSQVLGWEVSLVYLGPHRRMVLGNLAPGRAGDTGWTDTVKVSDHCEPSTPSQPSWLRSIAQGASALWSGKGASSNSNKTNKDGVKEDGIITFADLAAYLVITEESLKDVSARLPDGVEMDRTKFRPNIIVEGATGGAWEEDFWGRICIIGARGGHESEIVLTGNCARCKSINIDYSTGQAGTGEEGSVLKKLMKDRRVDPGTKWSPVFGRYGFLLLQEELVEQGQGQVEVNVGDEVFVSKWNEERTVFRWPGMGS